MPGWLVACGQGRQARRRGRRLADPARRQRRPGHPLPRAARPQPRRQGLHVRPAPTAVSTARVTQMPDAVLDGLAYVPGGHRHAPARGVRRPGPGGRHADGRRRRGRRCAPRARRRRSAAALRGPGPPDDAPPRRRRRVGGDDLGPGGLHPRAGRHRGHDRGVAAAGDGLRGGRLRRDHDERRQASRPRLRHRAAGGPSGRRASDGCGRARTVRRRRRRTAARRHDPRRRRRRGERTPRRPRRPRGRAGRRPAAPTSC